MNKCPFKVGDMVVFKPSEHWIGWNQVVPLEIGKSYKVIGIKEFQGEKCLMVEGCSIPDWYIYWREFQSD